MCDMLFCRLISTFPQEKRKVVNNHLSSWRSLRRSSTLSDSTDCFSLDCSQSRKLSCCFCRLERRKVNTHVALKLTMARDISRPTLQTCLSRWGVTPFVSACCGSGFWTCPPPPAALSASRWTRRVAVEEPAGRLSAADLSAAPDVSLHPLILRKPNGRDQKLWGAIHHQTPDSIYLAIDLFIYLQRVSAGIFPCLFCSQGSQSTHWRTAASPGTTLQRTAFHLQKMKKCYYHVYKTWLVNRI